MKFSIATEELSKGLYRAHGIVEKKTAMPILSNVLFVASNDGTVSITATDLEVGMIGVSKAEVVQGGSLTLSARLLYDIVRNLPESTLSISRLDNNWAEIKCGKIEYKMVGMAAEEFQGLPDVSGANLFEVDADQLRGMIEKTIYAVSNDETRYNLNGAYLEKLGEQSFRMVATDGHRLSMIDATLALDPAKAQFQRGIIIPKKGLVEMRRLIEAEEGSCFLGLEANNLVFKMNNVTVVMRLLDGQFPEYRQVIPDKQKIHFKIQRKQLQDCLRRISILSSDRTMGLKLSLQEGILQVATNNPDLGEAREEMEVSYSGSRMNVGFNARYLLDALASIAADEVEVSLEDDLSPGVFTPLGDDKYICVVMPMRI